MITRCFRPILYALALLAAGLSAACEKVPLLAPTGSTITLTAATNALSANGTADIIAQVLESSGVPPHSGTEVTFTTTIGTLQPATARTDVSGRVTVRYSAGASSGTATITASSGGATTGTTGAVRIAIGTAAVGRVSLSANPTTISANGGVSALLANVVDLNGNALTSVPVSFSTTAGTLASTLVSSDANGNAQTTLSTTTQATVTATVGVQTTGGTPTTGGTTPTTGGTTTGQAVATVTVNVNPSPTVSITAASGTLTAGSPITFTINVTPAASSTAQIRDVVVLFDATSPTDAGNSIDLGATTGAALTVQHVYQSAGTYVVRVNALDTLGSTTSAATSVVVQAQPPLTVSISKTSTPSGANTVYTLTASVTPASAIVSSYVWTLDSSTVVQSGGSNQLIQTFPTGAVHTIRVDVTTSGGSANNTVVLP